MSLMDVALPSSQSSGGGKPLRVTRLATGTGTFFPLFPGVRAKVYVQGAGGGGGRANATVTGGSAGAAGACAVVDMQLTDISYPYSVGAKGVGGLANNTAGTNGSVSIFGPIYAPGGTGGPVSGANVAGTPLGEPVAGQSTGGLGMAGGKGGGSGGTGNPGVTGGAPNYCLATTVFGRGNGGIAGAAGGGGGGGGDSLFGRGGQGGAGAPVALAGDASPGTGYGAGGGGGGGGATTGAGADGTGGIIIIEEYAV